MQNWVGLKNIDWDKFWGKRKLSKHTLTSNKYNYSGAQYLKVKDTEHD